MTDLEVEPDGGCTFQPFEDEPRCAAAATHLFDGKLMCQSHGDRLHGRALFHESKARIRGRSVPTHTYTLLAATAED